MNKQIMISPTLIGKMQNQITELKERVDYLETENQHILRRLEHCWIDLCDRQTILKET